MASGVITALGIALHNAPEGASVLIAGSKAPEVGLRLALAIGLHNIPEGVAVAAPIYVATGSRWVVCPPKEVFASMRNNLSSQL